MMMNSHGTTVSRNSHYFFFSCCFGLVLWLLSMTGNTIGPERNAVANEPKNGQDKMNQLVLTDKTPWKEDLIGITLEARFVTGKDLAVLDGLFSPEVHAEDNSSAERTIYLVMRLSMTENLRLYCGRLVLKAVREDDWPSNWALPDPVKLPPLGTKKGVVYYCKHVMGSALGCSDGYREMLLKKKWVTL